MVVEMRLGEIAESMESAQIAGWLKSEGERVQAGEVIAEVETDKTIVELQAPASGILAKIHAPPGSAAPAVGLLLAEIVSDEAAPAGGAAGDRLSEVPLEDPGRAQAVASPAVEAVATAELAPESIASTTSDVPATALARRMAEVLNLDLRQVPGTGPGGRIGRRDVERLRRPGQDPQAESVARRPVHREEATPAVIAAYTEQPMSAMRRVMAERLQAAKQTAPHFYLQIDCAMGAFVQLRERLNTEAESKLSVTDLVVRAAALALRQVPEVNSSFDAGTLRIFRTYDVAVAVNTPNGLITPVVKQADEKDVRTISNELKALIARARAGKLRPEEYAGGTFTISNLGMDGVAMLLPIVNPPQSCILGVGAIEERAIVRDGQLAIGLQMSCTLSADHRAVDGATGAKFLVEFRRLVGDPSRLLG